MKLYFIYEYCVNIYMNNYRNKIKQNNNIYVNRIMMSLIVVYFILSSLCLCVLVCFSSEVRLNIHVEPSPRATDLCFVMHFYKTDKGHPLMRYKHTYTNYYSNLFKHVRTHRLRIFEFGSQLSLGEDFSDGASLGKDWGSAKAWQYYFNEAFIFMNDEKLLFRLLIFNYYYQISIFSLRCM